MSVISSRIVSAGLAACLSASSVAAQKAAGTITGTLALESAAWYVDQEGESEWSWQGNSFAAEIVGEPKTGANGGSGALTIAFVAAGNPTELEVADFVISLELNGQELTSGPENVDLSLSALEVEEDSLVAAGSFAGQLAPEDGGSPDAEPITIDGNFQVTLRQPDADEG